MSGQNKSESVRVVLRKVFENLRSCDAFCLVGMQEQQRLIFPMTCLGAMGDVDARRDTLEKLADSVVGQAGYTAITQALEMGLGQLEGFELSERLAGRGDGAHTAAILLLSDGQEPPGNTLAAHPPAPPATKARYMEVMGQARIRTQASVAHNDELMPQSFQFLHRLDGAFKWVSVAHTWTI